MTVVSRILGALLLLVVAAVPLPLAGNRDWAWDPLAAVTAVLFIAFSAWTAFSREKAITGSHLPWLSAFAFLFVLAWATLRVLPFPVLPGFESILNSSAQSLGIAIPDRGSLDTATTIEAILRLLTYGMVFWLAVHLGRSRRFSQHLCWTLIGTALVVTLYGALMEATSRSCVVLLLTKRPLESGDPCTFSGTFVNSGNYATYAAMACIVCVAHIQDLLARVDARASGRRQQWRQRLLLLGGRGGMYIAALVILMGGLVFSASRAGLASFVAAAAVMIAAFAAGQRTRGNKIAMAMLVLLLVVGAFVAVMGDSVIRRSLALFSEGDSDRSALFRMTIAAIELRPWTGWGLGSFSNAYSMLQPPTLAVPFDKAHNLYLELAMDLGIPVACLTVAIVGVIAARCLKGIWARSRDAQYAAIGFGATVLVGLQSFVDFGLQIPANAVTFSALLGVGWAQSWSSRDP
jgi:hypothetical protein